MFNQLIEKYRKMPDPVKASIWYTFGNIINKGLALIAMPVFTRILTEEQYGTYAIYQSWNAILIIFTSLNIFLSGYQKGLLLYKSDKERFTSTQLGLTSIITILCFCIYAANVEFWTKIFDLSPLLMLFMFAELLVIPGLDFWASRQRFDYKYKSYVAITLAISVLSILGGIVGVLNSANKVEFRIFADVLVKVLIAGSLGLMIFVKGKAFYDKEYWKFAIRFNLPLIPHYLSNYVLNQSDRLMISKMVGKAEAAYYSVAYTISTMMLLVTTGINNSLTPYIYKKLDEEKYDELRRVSRPLIAVVALLCILTTIFAPEIILIFAGQNYLDAVYIVPPVSSSVYFIFLYGLFSNVEYFYQKTGYIAIATCAAAGLNIILNAVFIEKYGYYAAGYTTLICYVLLAFTHFLFYRKIEKSIGGMIKTIFDIRFIGIVSILLTITVIALAFTYNTRILRYSVSILLLIALWLNRKKFMDLFLRIRGE